MTSAAVHICIRRTLDWSDPAGVSAGIDPGFRQKFETWNATFDMPYAEFRRRMVEIATLNLSRVEGARLTPLAEVPPGAWIVPIDDDDWLAPDLVARVRRLLDAPVTGCRWRREVIEPLDDRRGPRAWLRRRRALEHFVCASNNHAILNTPEIAPLVRNHVLASEYFDAHPAELRRTPRFLAIQNRNPASQTALALREPTISRDRLVGVLDRYQGLYAGWKLRRSLRWAQPCLDRMAELVDSVGLR